MAGLCVAAAVLARHSPVIVDTDTISVIEGDISRFDWKNPHTYIFAETTNEAGEKEEWQLESDATPILFESIAERTVEHGGFGSGREISHAGTKDLPWGKGSITG